VTGFGASARERTHLAWDRTALSSAALSALLLKLGIEHSRWFEVAAGCAAGASALIITGAARWLDRRARLLAITLCIAVVAALIAVDSVSSTSADRVAGASEPA
jgi:uncharacterized membrane protein YidH (DUF202 family)